MAVCQKPLPGGPLVRVIVRGGAEWKNQNTANTTTAPDSTLATNDTPALNPKVSMNKACTRPHTVLRFACIELESGA